MYILFTVILIALIVVVLIKRKVTINAYADGSLYVIILLVLSFCFLGCFIKSTSLLKEIVSGRVIDDRIALYEEENIKI